jgi:hypothetical protein
VKKEAISGSCSPQQVKTFIGRNDYLEHDANRKRRNEMVASCEQEKRKQQKLEAKHGIFVAVQQHFVKRVAVVEVKDSFGIANRLQLAVEELLKETFLLDHVIDIFECLRIAKVNMLRNSRSQ